MWISLGLGAVVSRPGACTSIAESRATATNCSTSMRIAPSVAAAFLRLIAVSPLRIPEMTIARGPDRAAYAIARFHEGQSRQPTQRKRARLERRLGSITANHR